MLSNVLTQHHDALEWLLAPSKRFFSKQAGFQPWSDTIIDILAQFSEYLIKHADHKTQPELISLAFWCRKANIIAMKQDFETLKNNLNQQKPGKVFHVTPANVDTVFFYTLVIALLCGNQNIIRISQRAGQLTNVLLDFFNTFVQRHAPDLSDAVAIVQYDKQHLGVTKSFSHWSDLRLLWGSDQSIADINLQCPVKQQITFPSRYAIAVIHLNSEEQAQQAAKRFVTDTLPFKQQGCASAKAIFWLNTPKALQLAFRHTLEQYCKLKTSPFGVAEQTTRLINLQHLAMKESLLIDNLFMLHQYCHVEVPALSHDLLSAHQGFGLLFHQNITDLGTIPYTEKLQNVSHFGLNDHQLASIKLLFDKRLVEMGQALNFHYRWDGVNLLHVLSVTAADGNEHSNKTNN